MEEYLLLGYITDSFGLDGTVKVLSKTDFAEDRYQEGNIVYLFNARDNSRIEAEVIKFRKNGPFDFVKLNIINTKEEAMTYKGYEIQVIKDETELEEGYYFHSDLEKCVAYDENGNELGKVVKVEEYPAQNNLRIRRKNGKEILVPFIEVFVKSVDIKEKRIVIHVIEGMLWELPS